MNTMDSKTDIYNNDKIIKIIDMYKKSRERDKKKYEKKKDDPIFKQENRNRAKAHYDSYYKNVKKCSYDNNKDFLKNRSLLNYYKANNRVNEFITKYPDKVKCLEDYGLSVATLVNTSSTSGSGSN